jgi:hypothetical protein
LESKTCPSLICFFTTKAKEKGTGLGLSIVHGIVTRAGGKIEVATSQKGTTFTIRLPILHEEAKNEAAQNAQASVEEKSVKEAAKDLSLKSFPRVRTWVAISLFIVGVVLVFSSIAEKRLAFANT